MRLSTRCDRGKIRGAGSSGVSDQQLALLKPEAFHCIRLDPFDEDLHNLALQFRRNRAIEPTTQSGQQCLGRLELCNPSPVESARVAVSTSAWRLSDSALIKSSW
jgi:hypothetical protein